MILLTIHDHTYYQTCPTITLSSSGGTLLKLKSNDNKRWVKIHHYSIQSESDSQSVYFYDETGTQLSQKWTLNAREGVAKPFVPAPGFLLKSSKAGVDIGLYLTNATAVDFEVVYSNDDESMWAQWQDGSSERAATSLL